MNGDIRGVIPSHVICDLILHHVRHWRQETHVSIAYEGSHMGQGVLQFEIVQVQ
jgi:hypothetical protein